MTFNFEDFAPATFDVEIEIPYTKDVVRRKTVRLGMLSWREWGEVGAHIADPTPPFTKPGSDGRLHPNPTDKQYLVELGKTNLARDYHRLVVALERGGQYTFKSESKEDRLKEVSDMDAAIVQCFLDALSTMKRKGVARIQTRADNFLADGSLAHTGDESQGDQNGTGVE